MNDLVIPKFEKISREENREKSVNEQMSLIEYLMIKKNIKPSQIQQNYKFNDQWCINEEAEEESIVVDVSKLNEELIEKTTPVKLSSSAKKPQDEIPRNVFNSSILHMAKSNTNNKMS